MKSRFPLRWLVLLVIFFAFTMMLLSTAPHQEGDDGTPAAGGGSGGDKEEVIAKEEQEKAAAKRNTVHKIAKKHKSFATEEKVQPPAHEDESLVVADESETTPAPLRLKNKVAEKVDEQDDDAGPRSYTFNDDDCGETKEGHPDGVGTRFSFELKSLDKGIMMMRPRPSKHEKKKMNGNTEEKLFYADDALVVDTNAENAGHPLKVTKDPALPDGDHSAAKSVQQAMRGRKVAIEPSKTLHLPRFMSAACALQRPQKKARGGKTEESNDGDIRQVVQFQYCRTSKMIGEDDGDDTVAHGQRVSDQTKAETITPPCIVNVEMNHMSGDPEQAHKFAFKNQAKGDAATAATFSFRRRVSFYGLAMRGNGFKLQEGVKIAMKNLDINHYALKDSLGLYGTVPLIYAVDDTSPAKHTTGIFWLSGATIEAEISKDWQGSRLSIMSSEGGVKVFMLPGPTAKDVLKQYLHLTGKPMLPPYFSTGYHQCRWSYRNQRDVLEVNRGFDTNHVPCDAIWLDIDHTDGKRYFTWDKRKFPDPKKMQNTLWADSKRRMVTITDPHIKADTHYHVFSEGFKHGYFVNNQDGTSAFRGHCWPGESVWIDYYNPDARSWYATLFDYDRYEGSTKYLYSWNDMNEPSVFSGPDITFPFNVKHFDGTNHGQLHNMYGFYHSMATFQGHLRRNEDESRPFALTRSFFAGSQRYAAVWTGDNQAKWSHMKVSIDMVLQMQICGVPFVGADIGGFFDEPSPELILRWYQMGALYPFFRGHSHEQTRRREPWLTGHAFDDVRRAIQFRYKLLPYMYTAFWEASRYGDGIWRPLMLEFPNDAKGIEVTDTFMVGRSLLARPVVEMWQTTHEISVHFPVGASWYDYWTGDPVHHKAGTREKVVITEHDDNMVVPLWIRAGHIIVTKSSVGKSSENHGRYPYTVTVALDSDGEATGFVYLDDGISNEFKTGGRFCVVHFTFKLSTLSTEVFYQGAPDDSQMCNFDPLTNLPPHDSDLEEDLGVSKNDHIVGTVRIFGALAFKKFSGGAAMLTKGSKGVDTTSEALKQISVQPIDSFGPMSYDTVIKALHLPIVPTREKEYDGVHAESANVERVGGGAEMASWSIKFGGDGDTPNDAAKGDAEAADHNEG